MIHRPDLYGLQDRLLDLASELGLRLSREGVPAGEGRRSPPSGRPYLSRIPIRKKGSVQIVRVEDIAWIEADNYLVRIHAGGKVHVLRESMTSMESRLEPTRFFRVSRSAIVNLDRITEIQPFARGSHLIILDDGTRVLLSRSRRDTLEILLGQSL